GSKIWRYRTVKTILTNPAYIGNLCIRKNIKPSIGTNKRIKNDEANWLVTPNTHTAIVDSATWETVQEINEKAAKSFSAPTQQTKEYLFKGLVYCEDCKSPLQSSIEYQTRKNGKKVPYVSYYCSKYSSSGFSICSRHTIYELSLMKLVMKDINNLAGQLIVSKDEIVAKIKKDASAYTKVQFLENSNKLNKLKKEILANENALQKLYEDKITEIISSETFIQLSAEKKAETADLKKQADALELKLKHTEKTEQDITMWIESIKDIMLNSDKPLSREQLLSLIDRIEIGERQVIDGNKIQNVKIIYKQFSETIL
ncbi:recombinase family protein, partial [Tyzzerella sp. OttesenSCG-928-J15]|nr:recombinase family protein [Tyzzerella sp. OttesenSCG-928-J15]